MDPETKKTQGAAGNEDDKDDKKVDPALAKALKQIEDLNASIEGFKAAQVKADEATKKTNDADQIAAELAAKENGKFEVLYNELKMKSTATEVELGTLKQSYEKSETAVKSIRKEFLNQVADEDLRATLESSNADISVIKAVIEKPADGKFNDGKGSQGDSGASNKDTPHGGGEAAPFKTEKEIYDAVSAGTFGVVDKKTEGK